MAAQSHPKQAFVSRRQGFLAGRKVSFVTDKGFVNLSIESRYALPKRLRALLIFTHEDDHQVEQTSGARIAELRLRI